ncbi:hypothetical protein [Pontibacillus halophilus]|uniref:hypothetical protein n=1 Tax=Pontibacillus halophilus TaxID=516704 RepID=UPI00047DFE6F|nr:hypothetical protein [Pontibacillus halophilus]
MSEVIQIANRKASLKQLAKDQHLNQLIRNYLRLTVLTEEVWMYEKSMRPQLDISYDWVKDHMDLQQQKNAILDGQLDFLKGLIFQMCGVKDIYNEKINTLFEIRISSLLKSYNYEKDYINPFLVESLIYSLLNSDLL